jgi:hypothetical protein
MNGSREVWGVRAIAGCAGPVAATVVLMILLARA